MRIDLYLFTSGHAKSRTAAQAMIAEGRVFFDGVPVKKASFDLPESSQDLIEIRSGGCRYVSRGGLKLEAALQHFSIDVSSLCALDVGASTGGFTDCLLQHGASKVYAVDSGRAQFDPALSKDPRVVLRESCNARFLTAKDFADRIDFAVMDVSFISQILLFPALSSVLPNGAEMVTLIKPQFEVGRSGVGRGGIVRSEDLRKSAVLRVCEAASGYGFQTVGTIQSPIQGGDGNIEFLAYFRKECL